MPDMLPPNTPEVADVLPLIQAIALSSAVISRLLSCEQLASVSAVIASSSVLIETILLSIDTFSQGSTALLI